MSDKAGNRNDFNVVSGETKTFLLLYNLFNLIHPFIIIHFYGLLVSLELHTLIIKYMKYTGHG